MSALDTFPQSRIQDGWYQPAELETSTCSGTLSHHATPAEISHADIHYDFISFLAVAQRRKFDFLPITWQPALDDVGRGATAEIRQSFINLQMSFAFKRMTPLNSLQQGERGYRAFRALISEVSVLGHPSIRKHPNVINLEGICWDVVGEEEAVWPVLVFEKTQYGDLCKFMESDVGLRMSMGDRLKLCVDIATAVMDMHSSRE